MKRLTLALLGATLGAALIRVLLGANAAASPPVTLPPSPPVPPARPVPPSSPVQEPVPSLPPSPRHIRATEFPGVLAQITATFLAIIVAGILAYVVFLQERAAQFDERIAEKRLQISAALRKLPTEWRQLPLLPSQLTDTYRAYYPKASWVDLTAQAATDLLFRKPELASAFAEVRAQDSFGGPHAGRLYVWVLSEAALRLTADLIPAGGDEKYEVFPVTGSELGFKEWRRYFLKVYGALYMLSMDHDGFLSDFGRFLDGSKVLAAWQIAHIRENAPKDIRLLYERIRDLRSAVDYMDNQLCLSTAYRASERFRIQQRRPLPVAVLWDALNRPEGKQFREPLPVKLEEYLTVTQGYNASVLALSAHVGARMLKDGVLLRYRQVGSDPGGAGYSPNALAITSAEVRQQIRQNLTESPSTRLSFDNAAGQGIALRRNLTIQDVEAILLALETIGAEVQQKREFHELEASAKQTTEAHAALAATVEQVCGPSCIVRKRASAP